MIFKDRQDAARKLLQELKKDGVLKDRANVVVASLLRGGAVLGRVLSTKLKVPHLPLACAKIGAPFNEELAIGALTFDVVYLEKRVIDSIGLSKSEIREQIARAKEKFKKYSQRFSIKKSSYDVMSGKVIVIVDDGIATGATMKAAALFVKERGAKEVIVAAPVSAEDLDVSGIDRSIILHKDPHFSAVSQFYEEFPQVEDDEVKKILSKT